MHQSADLPLPARPALLGALIQHYDELVGYISRRFGDRGFASEIVHEVCVQILEKPDREPARQPLALLRRISHNVAVDRCRSEDARRAWLDAIELPQELPSPEPDIVRALSAEQELERLSRAIAALPLKRRQVFVMHKIHGVTQTETAARLGISVKMVEKQLRLGLLACRDALRDAD